MRRAFQFVAILAWPAVATAQSVYFGTLHSQRMGALTTFSPSYSHTATPP